MKTAIALAVCLFFSSVASAAGRSAELFLSANGSRVLARLSSCREYVHDWPQQCEAEETFAMPELVVDAATRTITHNGDVVARWSRFGRFVRMEPSFRLGHEISIETDSAGSDRRVTRRAKLFIAHVDAQ